MQHPHILLIILYGSFGRGLSRFQKRNESSLSQRADMHHFLPGRCDYCESFLRVTKRYFTNMRKKHLIGVETDSFARGNCKIVTDNG